MKSTQPLFVAALMLAPLSLTLGAAAQDPAPLAKEADIADIVFFGKDRPILLRLHMSVDGRSMRQFQDEYVEQWFRYLDVDEDGLLSAEELRWAPDGKGMAHLFGQGGIGLTTSTLMEKAPTVAGILKGNGDKVTLAEFQAYYASHAPRVRIVSDFHNATLANQAGERLFKALDVDGDGKLSMAELQGLSRVLARLDTNGDEFLTAQELANAENDAGNSRFFMDEHINYTGQVGKFFHAQRTHHAPGDDRVQPGKRLAAALLQLDRDGSKTLNRAESGLDEETFNKLDVNRDGELDANELAHWHERPADLEFTVRLGKESAIAIGKAGKNSPQVSKVSDHLCHFTMKDDVIHLIHADSRPASGMRRLSFFDIKNLEEEFKKKGFLELADYQRFFGLSPRLFHMIDRDGDGKATPQEWQRFFMMAEPARDLCVYLCIGSPGQGLFQFLDADGDGRLSQHELLQGRTRLAALDQGKTGFITAKDLPRQYQLTVHGLRPDSWFPAVQPLRVDQTWKNAPEWFRKMDRNGDGFVSPVEFLGTRAEFDRIDTDGDGLISAEEAIRHDVLLRKKK